MRELVSIIIPVYNRELFIVDSLNSARNQTYENIEIIVIDNFSTDNTWDVIKSISEQDNRIKIFQNSHNIGPVNSWFKGIALASGEFIKIIWSDDFIDDTFVSKAMELYNEDTAFVMSGTRNFSLEGYQNFSKFQKLKAINSKQYLSDVLIYNRYKFPVSPGCAIFRKRAIIENVPKSLENLDNLDFSKNGAGIDLLFFLTSTLTGSKIKIIDENLSHFRAHSDSITVQESDSLYKYYEIAKLYFINKHANEFLNEFKTSLRIKSWFNPTFITLNKQIEGKYVFNLKFVRLFLNELLIYIFRVPKYFLKKIFVARVL